MNEVRCQSSSSLNSGKLGYHKLILNTVSLNLKSSNVLECSLLYLGSFSITKQSSCFSVRWQALLGCRDRRPNNHFHMMSWGGGGGIHFLVLYTFQSLLIESDVTVLVVSQVHPCPCSRCPWSPSSPARSGVQTPRLNCGPAERLTAVKTPRPVCCFEHYSFNCVVNIRQPSTLFIQNTTSNVCVNSCWPACMSA